MASIRAKVDGILWGALLLAVLAAYSNHFGNGFHFDDRHAVVENPAIRNLSEVPHFFVDASSFSREPAGRSYRPLVTASLALDYWLGGGLNPFWFHLSTFVWFLVLLLVMYWLGLFVLQRTCPSPRNRYIAWLATALYGLHPVSAETVNYIVQRGDLYVALGCVASIAVYAWKPAWRCYGLYLIPALAGMFAKPTGVIFAPLLLAYFVLVERLRPIDASTAENRKRAPNRQQPRTPALSSEPVATCLLRSMPAFALSAAFLVLEKVMTPPTFFQTKIGTLDYWVTQPFVTLRYFRSFFFPFYLSADTDLSAFHSLNPAALAGGAFCVSIIAAAVFTARKRDLRPVSFGLWWFLIALIPTALFPLGEVENDHRMFLPFIGLSLAMVYSAAIVVQRFSLTNRRVLGVATMAVLAALAYGTYRRNEVWHTEESLWRDVTQKSPYGARAHVNYGLALSEIPGRLPEAISEYREALRIDPDSADAHGNLGVALSHMPGHLAEAITEYDAALRVRPENANVHLNLGKALVQIPGRLSGAIREFEATLQIDPDSADAHLNLGSALSQIPDRLPQAITEFRAALQIQPNFPEAHCSLATALSKSGRLPEAIEEYQTALRMKPDYGEAHLNSAVTLLQIPGRLSEVVEHYEAALRIDPERTQAHLDLGPALASLPNRTPEAALAELHALVQLMPASAEAHYALGTVLSKIPARLPEAIDEYGTTLRLKPDYAIAHTSRGIVSSRIPQRLTEAIADFEAAVKLQPNSAETHSNLALALSMAGRKLEAISEFEASFRLRPDPAVRQMLANLGAQASARAAN